MGYGCMGCIGFIIGIALMDGIACIGGIAFGGNWYWFGM